MDLVFVNLHLGDSTYQKKDQKMSLENTHLLWVELVECLQRN